MDLSNSFHVARPIGETWKVLTDVERIAPCLPGAQLQEVEGDEYRGVVKVKIGPITAQYKGAATFVEQNDADYKVVINGKGRDTRGAGNAEALITAKLEALSDTTTQVNVDTDLKVTGKVAQFGRGVIPEVSANLMDQFAQNLEQMLESEGADGGAAEAAGPEAAAPGSSDAAVDAAEPTARKIDMPEPEAIDLMDAAGTPVLKRVVPLVAVVILLLVLRRILRNRRS